MTPRFGTFARRRCRSRAPGAGAPPEGPRGEAPSPLPWPEKRREGLAGRRRGLAQPGSRRVVVGGARDTTRFSRSQKTHTWIGHVARVKRRSMGVPFFYLNSSRLARASPPRGPTRVRRACRRSTAAAALPRAIVRVDKNDFLRARSKTRFEGFRVWSTLATRGATSSNLRARRLAPPPPPRLTSPATCARTARPSS